MADAPLAPGIARAPRRLFPVTGPDQATMRTPDGVDLVSGIYRPNAPGRFPALVMRQPYGRKIASTVVLAHPAWYAARGYVVIVQDVRGRGDSGGLFRVLEDDAADGAATLDWAAGLSFCNGQVVTYGFSYQAMTQLLALAGAVKAGGKRPDAIVPAMGAWSVRDDWAYEGGAFRLAGNLSWACQMGAEQARLGGDRDAFDSLAAAARGAPWNGGRPAWPEIANLIGGYAPHYQRWLADDAAAFVRMSPADALVGMTLATPALAVGGWCDIMLEGTLRTHAAFRRDNKASRLIIGPWSHIPWGRAQGSLDLGPDASSPVDEETIRFLDFHLKQQGEPGPPVKLFDVGARRWRDFDSFPEQDATSLFLSSHGRAAATTVDGALDDAPGDAGADYLVHDPWRPAPVIGGHLGDPGGFCDRAAIDDRGDVAVYTSAPFEKPLALAGRVAADLHVSSDMPSHDLHCTLSFIAPGDARAITLTSGHLRVFDSAVKGPRRVAMRAACATLPAGARLRLSIQAAAFPAFAVNPGSGVRAEDAHSIEAQVTTLKIAHGFAAPSRLLLPVLT